MVSRVGMVAGMTFIIDYQRGRFKDLSNEYRIRYSRYSHHLPREEKCFLGRRREGGEDDLYRLGLQVGGRNHLPGMSEHWGSSGPRGSPSSSSGDPLGISKMMTGGKSSRGMREVKAAAGGSSPTSMTESGWAASGGVCG